MIDEERIQQLVHSKTVEELTKGMFMKDILVQLKTISPIENEGALIRSILVSVKKKLEAAGNEEMSSSSSSSSSKETVDDLSSRVILDIDQNNDLVIDQKFSEKFGRVVWARSTPAFPWWPSYVIDPRIISTLSAAIRKRAISAINKRHCVYYYGSGEYDFVLPTDKQMQDYIDHRSEYELAPAPKYRSQFEMALSMADSESIIEPAFRTIYVTTQIVSLLPSPSKDDGNGVSVKRGPGRPKKKNTAEAVKLVEELPEEKGSETTTVVKSRGRHKQEETAQKTKKVSRKTGSKETATGIDDSKALLGSLPTKPTTDVVKKKVGRPPKEDKSVPENVVVSPSSAKKRTSSKISQASADITDHVVEPRQKIKKAEPHSSSFDDGLLAMDESLSTEVKMDMVKKLISTLEHYAQVPDAQKAIKIMRKLSGLTLNIEELTESKAAGTISSLRKHEDATIAAEAKNLRRKWIDEQRNMGGENKIPKEQAQPDRPQPNPSQPQIQEQKEEQSELGTVPLVVTAGEVVVMGTQSAVAEENNISTVSGNLCRSRVVRMLTELLVSGLDHADSAPTQEIVQRAAVRLEMMAFRLLCVAVPSSSSSSTSVTASAGHSSVDIAIATTMNRYLANISRLAFGLQLSGAERCRSFLLHAPHGAFLTSTTLVELLQAKTADEFAKIITSPF